MKEKIIGRTATKTYPASDAVGYALYAFGGLGTEGLLMSMETMLYGQPFGAWTPLKSIAHWLLTCLIWGGFAIVLTKRLPAAPQNRIQKKNAIAAIALACVSILFTSLAWKGFKPGIEAAHLGAGRFAAQYLYYAFESWLVLLIVAHGQLAFEHRFGSRNVPFGGIFLAGTWGLVHILTQGAATGIYTVIQSLLFGSVYVLLNKNYKISYVAMALMFML